MASRTWTPETSGILPIVTLVDPTKAPSPKDTLLCLIIEHCKRLAKDQDLNKAICDQLKTLKTSEMKILFKKVTSLQFKRPSQTDLEKAPQADKVSSYHIYGLDESSGDVFIEPQAPLTCVYQPEYTMAHYINIGMNRPGSKLCSLALVEFRLHAIKSTTRYVPVFFDMTASSAYLPDPSVKVKLKDIATSSKASSSSLDASSSSSYTHPSDRKITKVRHYGAVPIRKVDKVPLVAVEILALTMDYCEGLDSHDVFYFGRGTALMKIFPESLGGAPAGVVAAAAAHPAMAKASPRQARAVARTLTTGGVLLAALPSSQWDPRLWTELDFWTQNNHPYLAPLIGCSGENSIPALLFLGCTLRYNFILHPDYLSRGKTLTRHQFDEICDILLVAGDALAFMHSIGKVHGRFWDGCIGRDLSQIRIYDYTETDRIPLPIPDDTHACDSRLLFQAPEALENDYFDAACDVYSFGVFLWRCFHLQYLNDFNNRHILETPKLTCTDELRFVSIGLQPLFERCIAKDPSARPTMAEVVAELASLLALFRQAENWIAPVDPYTNGSRTLHSDQIQWALGPDGNPRY